MKNFIIGHSQIFLPIMLLTYANLVMKWQVNNMPSFTESGSIFKYAINIISNTWMLSAFIAAGLAGCAWVVALKSFDISYAYPFISLSFLFVTLGGVFLLGENFSRTALLGLVLIIIGVSLTAKSGFYK